MRPKLVLVITLLGVASLDWLASAEQGDESPNLTLEEAKQKLRNSSLKPNEVAKILGRLDESLQIDRVPVRELLEIKAMSPCSWRIQKRRAETCLVLTTESVRNYCYHWVRRISDHCQAEPDLVLKGSFDPHLKEEINKLTRALYRAKQRPEDDHTLIKQRVTELRREQMLFLRRKCRGFLESKEKVAQYFGIDVSETVATLGESDPLKYLHYADLHCKTAVEAVDRAIKETMPASEASMKLNDPSLSPIEVNKILIRVEKNQQIDGVRVEDLLWPNEMEISSMRAQERRMKNCNLVKKQSLKNYCNDLVERVKQHCQRYGCDKLLETYADTQLEQIVRALSSVAKEAKDKNKDRQDAFNRWMAKQKSDFVNSVERECRRFYKHDARVKELFGINLKGIRKLSGYSYLRDAKSYCKAALEAVEKRRHTRFSLRLF
jgi:hypothetical protein